MKSLFAGVSYQFIDALGKTRVLLYASGVTLVVSPQPQLDVPEISKYEISKTSLSDAISFVDEKKMKIISQTRSSDSDESIIGLWVNLKDSTRSPISYGYIPLVDGSKAINGVEFSHPSRGDPFFPTGGSDLKTFKQNYRIAEYLKAYTIFVWAEDPKNFGVKSFKILPDHQYNPNERYIINTLNSTYYRLGKVIVTDEEIIPRLINYVSTQSLNDSGLLVTRLSTMGIDPTPFLVSVNDFTQRKDNIVFIGRDSVKKWKMNDAKISTNNTVFYHLRPEAKEPYLYTNLNIRKGELCIIQNTIAGDLPSALEISDGWEPHSLGSDKGSVGINSGYLVSPADLPEKYGLEVYTIEGMTYHKKKEGGVLLKVFCYPTGEYAGLIPLRNVHNVK